MSDNVETMNEAAPIRASNVTVDNVGNETLVYAVEAEAIHVLNRTAKLVWDLCDGTHSVSDMEQIIRTQFSVPPGEDVAGDIENTLEQLANKGLLQNGDDDAVSY